MEVSGKKRLTSLIRKTESQQGTDPFLFVNGWALCRFLTTEHHSEKYIVLALDFEDSGSSKSGLIPGTIVD